MLSMVAVTPSNTLTSQYPTKQENYNQNYCSIKSPSPTSTPTSTSLTMTSPPQLHNPHASITLPSIHSLDIPAFPHYEQEYSRASVFQNYSSNSPTPSNSSYSPTLLIPVTIDRLPRLCTQILQALIIKSWYVYYTQCKLYCSCVKTKKYVKFDRKFRATVYFTTTASSYTV